jgi:hypothetical protein
VEPLHLEVLSAWISCLIRIKTPRVSTKADMDQLSECPSEVMTMLLGYLEDISDLENVMLACPHVWRCLEHDSYFPPILNELVTRKSVP